MQLLPHCPSPPFSPRPFFPLPPFPSPSRVSVHTGCGPCLSCGSRFLGFKLLCTLPFLCFNLSMFLSLLSPPTPTSGTCMHLCLCVSVYTRRGQIAPTINLQLDVLTRLAGQQTPGNRLPVSTSPVPRTLGISITLQYVTFRCLACNAEPSSWFIPAYITHCTQIYMPACWLDGHGSCLGWVPHRQYRDRSLKTL